MIYLFLSRARVKRGSVSSDLLMCGGGVCNILLLPLVARCLDTIYVCIWRMFVYVCAVKNLIYIICL